MSYPSTTRGRKRLGHGLAWFLSSSLLSTLLSTTPLVQAQAPVGSRRMGYAVLDDTLYIQGGFDTVASSQFVALDLSTSWPTSAAAWTRLKDGQATTHLALAPMSSSVSGAGAKGGLLSVGGLGSNPFFSSFDVNSGSWQTLPTVKAPYTYLEGHAAVTDPNTGLVYIVGGYGNSTFNMLSVYDPKSKVTVSASSATAATSLTDVGAVWLNSRNTILTFGGSRAPPASTQGLGSGELNEYDPASKTWNTMSTSGDVPPARLDHCMAASDDGSKVVVFGGTSDNLNEYFNTIYVLDVKNGKWKQGQSASVARTRMACAFHSSQFIAWGGSSSSSRTTMLNNIPIVYNLNNNKWTDNYNADETPKASSSSSNVGKLVGALVAMFVIAIGVGYFVMKKRQKRKQAEEDAYRSDALTAAAIQSREDVLHDDSNIKVQVNSIYGNIYAMSPMDSQGYASAHSNGSEKVNSSPYSYSTGTPRTAQQSPQAVFAQHDGASNPFSSPDDFTHPPTSHYGSPYSAQSTTFYAPPPTSSTKSDPFQVPYSPAYSQTTTYYGQSPTPGARSPQVIPETATSDDQHHHDNQRGYVPPPM